MKKETFGKIAATALTLMTIEALCVILPSAEKTDPNEDLPGDALTEITEDCLLFKNEKPAEHLKRNQERQERKTGGENRSASFEVKKERAEKKQAAAAEKTGGSEGAEGPVEKNSFEAQEKTAEAVRSAENKKESVMNPSENKTEEEKAEKEKAEDKETFFRSGEDRIETAGILTGIYSFCMQDSDLPKKIYGMLQSVRRNAEESVKPYEMTASLSPPIQKVNLLNSM